MNIQRLVVLVMSAHPERSGVMSSLLSGLQMLGAGLILFLAARFLHQDQSILAWMLAGLSVAALGVFLVGREK